MIQPELLGKAIATVRAIKKITQAQVSATSKLTINYLSLLENGQRSVSIDSLNEIAEALGVQTEWIVFLGCNSQDALTKSVKQMILEKLT